MYNKAFLSLIPLRAFPPRGSAKCVNTLCSRSAASLTLALKMLIYALVTCCFSGFASLQSNSYKNEGCPLLDTLSFVFRTIISLRQICFVVAMGHIYNPHRGPGPGQSRVGMS